MSIEPDNPAPRPATPENREKVPRHISKYEQLSERAFVLHRIPQEDRLRRIAPRARTPEEEQEYRNAEAELKNLNGSPLFQDIDEELSSLYSSTVRPAVLGSARLDKTQVKKELAKRKTEEPSIIEDELFWDVYPEYQDGKGDLYGARTYYRKLGLNRMIRLLDGQRQSQASWEWDMDGAELVEQSNNEVRAARRIRDIWIKNTLVYGVGRGLIPDLDLLTNKEDLLPVIRDYIRTMDERKGWSNVEDLVGEAKMLTTALLGMAEHLGMTGQEFNDVTGEASSRIFLHLGSIAADYGMEKELGAIIKMYSQEGKDIDDETGEKSYQQAVRSKALIRANGGRVGLVMDAMFRNNYWVPLGVSKIWLGDQEVPLTITDDNGNQIPKEGEPLTPAQHSAKKRAIKKAVIEWASMTVDLDKKGLADLPYEKKPVGQQGEDSFKPESVHKAFTFMTDEQIKARLVEVETILENMQDPVEKDRLKEERERLERSLKPRQRLLDTIDSFELARQESVCFLYADQEGAPVVEVQRPGEQRKWVSINDEIIYRIQHGWVSSIEKDEHGNPQRMLGLGEGVQPLWPRWGMGDLKLREELRNDNKTDSPWLNMLRHSLKSTLRYMYDKNLLPDDKDKDIKRHYKRDELPAHPTDSHKEAYMYTALLDKLNELYDIARVDTYKEYIPTARTANPKIKYPAYQSLAVGPMLHPEIFWVTTSKQANMMDERIMPMLPHLSTGLTGLRYYLGLRNPVEMVAIAARSDAENPRKEGGEGQCTENYDFEIYGGDCIDGAHEVLDDMRRLQAEKDKEPGVIIKAVSSTAVERLLDIEEIAAKGHFMKSRHAQYEAFVKVLNPYISIAKGQGRTNKRAELSKTGYMYNRQVRIIKAAIEFIAQLPPSSDAITPHIDRLTGSKKPEKWEPNEGWNEYIAKKTLVRPVSS